MKTNKRVDLGEYKVDIEYNSVTGEIYVGVLDELEDVIETIHITNDEVIDESDEDAGEAKINPELN